MNTFPPGTRVHFRTVLGECLGTVERVQEGDVHSDRSDEGGFPILLLLERSLVAVDDEADVPFVVVA